MDVQAGAFALGRVLISLGEEVLWVGEAQPDLVLKTLLLPGEEFSQGDMSSEDLVIEVGTDDAEVGQLSYDVAKSGLKIFLKSKHGKLRPGNVRAYPFIGSNTAAVLVGVSSPEMLGDFYYNNTEVFHKLPKLVIDNSPSNERFGEVNLADPSRVSLSELMFDFLKTAFPDQSLDSVSTLLLAGLMSATDSLKSARTSPASFQTASELMSVGADHSRVASLLFKTLGFPEVKLLGKVLAGITELPQGQGAYAVVDRTTSAGIEHFGDMEKVLPEVIQNTASFKGLCVIDVHKKGTDAYLLGDLPFKLRSELGKSSVNNVLVTLPNAVQVEKITLSLGKLEALKVLADILE